MKSCRVPPSYKGLDLYISMRAPYSGHGDLCVTTNIDLQHDFSRAFRGM